MGVVYMLGRQLGTRYFRNNCLLVQNRTCMATELMTQLVHDRAHHFGPLETVNLHMDHATRQFVNGLMHVRAMLEIIS
jgi:hypothetical protein